MLRLASISDVRSERELSKALTVTVLAERQSAGAQEHPELLARRHRADLHEAAG